MRTIQVLKMLSKWFNFQRGKDGPDNRRRSSNRNELHGQGAEAWKGEVSSPNSPNISLSTKYIQHSQQIISEYIFSPLNDYFQVSQVWPPWMVGWKCKAGGFLLLCQAWLRTLCLQGDIWPEYCPRSRGVMYFEAFAYKIKCYTTYRNLEVCSAVC